MLLVPKHVKDELETAKHEEGKKFVKDRVIEIAHAYYSKFKDIKELWILFAAKKDFITGKINVMIRAVDRPNKAKLDVPMQGCQLWYTNQETGDAYPEWILPLSKPKEKDNLERVSEGNPLIKDYFNKASQRVGRDLLTGDIINKKGSSPC